MECYLCGNRMLLDTVGGIYNEAPVCVNCADRADTTDKDAIIANLEQYEWYKVGNQHVGDKLDIFEMPMDAKIITTIEELQRLYFLAYDNATAEMDQDAIIQGDIV